MNKKEIITQFEQLISRGWAFYRIAESKIYRDLNDSNQTTETNVLEEFFYDKENESQYNAYRLTCLVFIKSLLGNESDFAKDYEGKVNNFDFHSVNKGISILKAARDVFETNLGEIVTVKILKEKSEIQNLIIKNNLKKALDETLNINNGEFETELILLKSSLEDIESRYRTGRLDFETENKEKSRIKFSILEILKKI